MEEAPGLEPGQHVQCVGLGCMCGMYVQKVEGA